MELTQAMKKAIAVVALVAVVMLMSANSASALTIRRTMDESTVNSSAGFLVTLFNRFFNNSTINNDTVDSRASSGANVLVGADDSGDWSVTTGNTTSATLAENSANATDIEGKLDTSVGGEVLVEDTSDESTVNQSSSDTLADDEQIENNQEVNNNQTSTADSGANVGNSGDELYRATFKTGTADSATGTSNTFNLVSKMWSRFVR